MITPRILIVDDEPEVRSSFMAFLRPRLNCTITEMCDGKEALDAVEREAFHVILLDQHMPGIDGFTVLERVRQKAPETIVLMVTGLGGAALSHKVERLGGIYIAKPVSLKALLLIIERELDRRGGFNFRTVPAS